MGRTTDIDEIKKYGLIGKTLLHSFSETFFKQKFKKLKLFNNSYDNFEFLDEKALADFLIEEVYTLNGFNITIPYKEIIIPYLDELSSDAKAIQAVNTVLVKDNRLIGYNTDAYGFYKSLKPLLKKEHKKALILGAGGASKAIAYVLSNMEIAFTFVSRNSKEAGFIHYNDLNKKLLEEHQIIINCTPIGTMPNTDQCPDIPYQFLNDSHLVYDLVYNPIKTKFLIKAEKKGAQIQNGLKMLQFQAEKSWEIWNS